MKIFYFIIITFLVTAPLIGLAHPGRTASDGCHYCRTNCDSYGEEYDERHCHYDYYDDTGGESYDDDYEYSSNFASGNNEEDGSWMWPIGGFGLVGYLIWIYRKNGRKRQDSKKSVVLDEKTRCPKCNSAMILKEGRYGSFYGCSKFPRCRGTRRS